MSPRDAGTEHGTEQAPEQALSSSPGFLFPLSGAFGQSKDSMHLQDVRSNESLMVNNNNLLYINSIWILMDGRQMDKEFKKNSSYYLINKKILQIIDICMLHYSTSFGLG